VHEAQHVSASPVSGCLPAEWPRLTLFFLLSSETGEHVQDSNDNVLWAPFPTCRETGRALEFHYGREAELNCTVDAVSDELYHQLEFYVHADAPLACRLRARPSRPSEVLGVDAPPDVYVPLVFALAGTLELSHVHVATRLNVLVHAAPHHGVAAHRWHDAGVLDSAVAYSTGTLSRMDKTGREAVGAGEMHTQRVIIGDPLALTLSVRWLPGAHLPHSDGRVDWNGLPGRVCAGRTAWWLLVGAVCGAAGAGFWVVGVVLPRRARGVTLGGATPLGYAGGGGGGKLGGWGYSKKKQKD
jgi:hypothetical protein